MGIRPLEGSVTLWRITLVLKDRISRRLGSGWKISEQQAEGRRPWEPATREELILADDEGLLLLNPQWLPGRQGLRLLGLPYSFGQKPRPWAEKTQERFLSTLTEDPEFLAAVRMLIGGQRA